MKIDDIPQFRRVAYKKVCSLCYSEQLILTQDDNYPEYETEIYLQCQCGEFIAFVLPVN